MWNYHNPVAVHAGINSLAKLPALLQNRRALLITFPEAAALGVESQLKELLGTQLAGIISAVEPNPDVSWLAPMYEQLWRDYADVPCIIACGGGSVIDCAKAMLTQTHDGSFAALLAHLQDNAPLDGTGAKQLIAIPTTAGTGSEVTPWATIWDSAGGRKYSLHQAWTWPQAAIIDAQLMLTLPHSMTLASALDALSHALESIWNVNRNPISSTLASAAAKRIIATLPALLEQPRDLVLREQMALAALQAGLAFSNTKTALAHSLSYDITLQQGVVHGIACAFSLPQVMARAFGKDAAVDALLSGIFETHEPAEAVQRLSGFLHSLGVSTELADYGISSTWETLIERALQGARGRNFITTSESAAYQPESSLI